MQVSQARAILPVGGDSCLIINKFKILMVLQYFDWKTEINCMKSCYLSRKKLDKQVCGAVSTAREY